MTDAELYSIEPGNAIRFCETDVKIVSIEGETVTLASRTHTATRTVTEIIRWVDRGRATVRD